MIQFEILKQHPLRHGLTTRLGGVSKGNYGLMNTGFFGGDHFNDVCENVAIAISTLEMDAKIIVLTQQVHGTDILTIDDDTDFTLFSKVDVRGTALEAYDVFRAPACDGLRTKRDDLILMIYYADCVPILVYDAMEHEAIAIHSGWKGTAKAIVSAIGSPSPEALYAGIGQSAGVCCYEVDEHVYKMFEKQFSPEQMEVIFTQNRPGHYMLDLKGANALLLKTAGVKEEHIEVSSHCTICQAELFHSHRRSGGEPRGSMSGFIQLNPRNTL